MFEVPESVFLTVIIFSLGKKWGQILPDWRRLSHTLAFFSMTFLP